MISYLELNEKTRPAVNLLNSDEKALLIDMLFEYGMKEKDITELDPEEYHNNRVVAVVYQMIVNDSV